jgi:accessory gene regulator B
VTYNFIDRSALYLAQSIRKHNPNAASEKALFYSLCLMINTFTAITITLVVGTLTGHFIQSILAILSYTILRYFSGGGHMNSSLSCCILSTVIFIGISHSSTNFMFTGFLFNTIAWIILIFTVPDGIEKISRINPKYYPILKLVCFLIVSSNYLIQSPIISASFLAQALLTTKAGHHILFLLERRWLK